MDNIRDLDGGSVAGDGESVDTEGVGPGGLVQPVDLLAELIDDLVLASDLLT